MFSRLHGVRDMTQLVKRQLIKTLLLTSALVGSSACSSLNLAVPGFEHFTLVGELPADFSSKITATYNPTQREGCTRTFYSYGLGKEVTELNQHFAIFETERNPQPQQIKQQIPLSYKLVGCTLQLASVDFKVVGHYGPDPVFDKFPSGGGLKIYDKRPEQAPRFPANGTLEVRDSVPGSFKSATRWHAKEALRSFFTATGPMNSGKLRMIASSGRA